MSFVVAEMCGRLTTFSAPNLSLYCLSLFLNRHAPASIFGPAADYPDIIIASMPTLGFHCVPFEVGKALFIAPVRKPDSYSNLTNT
jgi:hypothetical protein